MRLDKFLKVSRLIKRRPLAKKIADQGRVKVNGQLAKAATSIAKDDEIEIQFGQTTLTVLVKEVKEVVRKEEAEQLYEIIKEQKINREE